MTTREKGENACETTRLRDFGRFLETKQAELERQQEFFVVWASLFDRFCQRRGRHPSAEAVQPFLAELKREKAPWQVDQAQKAVRLFIYFVGSHQDDGAHPGQSMPDAKSPKPPLAFDWTAAMADMTRVMRVRHLSLCTERAYLGWLRKFMAFTSARSTGRPGVDPMLSSSPSS